MKAADVAARFKQLGIDPVGNSPEAYNAQIRAAYAKYGQVVKAAGVTKARLKEIGDALRRHLRRHARLRVCDTPLPSVPMARRFRAWRATASA